LFFLLFLLLLSVNLFVGCCCYWLVVVVSPSHSSPGDRYIHGLVAHQFAGSPSFAYTLQARTRQFSSFILLLGSIGAVDTFYPKQAIILQNKARADEFFFFVRPIVYFFVRLFFRLLVRFVYF
jgi:hypothetical protein